MTPDPKVNVFIIKPEELRGVLQGHAILIRPTNGMLPFFMMAEPAFVESLWKEMQAVQAVQATVQENGHPPATLMAQPIKPIKALRHPNRTYHCGLCKGRAFPNQSAYMRHQIRVHRGGSVKNGIRKKRHAKS